MTQTADGSGIYRPTSSATPHQGAQTACVTLVERLRSWAKFGLSQNRSADLTKAADALETAEKAMEAIIREQDDGTGNAPGHGHSRIGIWDDDPGNAAVGRANLPCEWCATWNEARAALEKMRSGR